MSSYQKLCLRWNNHTTNLLDALNSLLSSQQHSDVTLACQGEVWHLHRLVLSASSSHFAGLLAEVTPGQSPMIIVDGPTAQDISALIRFIYHGEVSVDQEHLHDLLKTAAALKIKGLAEFPVDEASCLSTAVTSTPQHITSYQQPPKVIKSTEYSSCDPAEDVPLNLSNKRPRYREPPKDYSFKKRIIQEECPDYGRKYHTISTNILHNTENFPVLLRKTENNPTKPTDFSNHKYVQPGSHFDSKSFNVEADNKHGSLTDNIVTLPNNITNDSKVQISPELSECKKIRIDPLEIKSNIIDAQTKNYSVVSTTPNIPTTPDSVLKEKTYFSPHTVPPIKRFKALESFSSKASFPNSTKEAISVPASVVNSPSPLVSPTNPTSQITTISPNKVNAYPLSPEIKYSERVTLKHSPEKILALSNPVPGLPSEYKFISVKQETPNNPNNALFQSEEKSLKTVYVQKTPNVKEEVVYVKTSPPLSSNELIVENANPILSSAFLSSKNSSSTAMPMTCASFVKITSSPVVLTTNVTPQLNIPSPQQSTVSMDTPLSTASVSSTDLKVLPSSVLIEKTSPSIVSNSLSAVTTTSTSGVAPTAPSSGDHPNSTITQRVSVNMRTFKEEWRRQLLVDYDPRSNMSICMLCFTTFKSYDGPRKNTYVKHAKRFHPVLDEYSEEERDLIINNYEKQYKYDVDMQKEVNKTFRCGGGVSVSSGGRPGKFSRNHQVISGSSTTAVTSSSNSSTGSNSLPGSRPDTDGEEESSPTLPGKSRSGTPESDHGGETREQMRVTPTVSPSYSTPTPLTTPPSIYTPSHSFSSNQPSHDSVQTAPGYKSRHTSTEHVSQYPPNNNNNLSSFKNDPKSRSKLQIQTYSSVAPLRHHTESGSHISIAPPTSSNQNLTGNPSNLSGSLLVSDSSDTKIAVTVAAI